MIKEVQDVRRTTYFTLKYLERYLSTSSRGGNSESTVSRLGGLPTVKMLTLSVSLSVRGRLSSSPIDTLSALASRSAMTSCIFAGQRQSAITAHELDIHCPEWRSRWSVLLLQIDLLPGWILRSKCRPKRRRTTDCVRSLCYSESKEPLLMPRDG